MAPAHPAEALRLLQLCAVARFSHFVRGLPPEFAASFFCEQDALVLDSFRRVSACAAELGAYCTFRLPVALGGAGLPSMARHCLARYVGGFFYSLLRWPADCPPPRHAPFQLDALPCSFALSVRSWGGCGLYFSNLGLCWIAYLFMEISVDLLIEYLNKAVLLGYVP